MPTDTTNRSTPLMGCDSHPDKYNQRTPKQITNLRLSLRRFGQVRSIVVQTCVDGRFTIVAGHGVLQTALEGGWAELKADALPFDWPPSRCSRTWPQITSWQNTPILIRINGLASGSLATRSA